MFKGSKNKKFLHNCWNFVLLREVDGRDSRQKNLEWKTILDLRTKFQLSINCN